MHTQTYLHTSTERETHHHARARTRKDSLTHTHTQLRTQADKQTQTVTIIERSPCVPAGKLFRLDINCATNARTHVQRIRSRFDNQPDCNYPATSRKEARSTDAPETYVYDITGPERIYADDLSMHFSCRAHDPRTSSFAYSSLTCWARPRPICVVLSSSAVPGRNTTHTMIRVTCASQ